MPQAGVENPLSVCHSVNPKIRASSFVGGLQSMVMLPYGHRADSKGHASPSRGLNEGTPPRVTAPEPDPLP